VTAILAALVSGYLGYKWQGLNLALQINAQQLENRRDREIRVREQTLIPFRNQVAELQAAALELIAAAQTGERLDEGRLRYVTAVSEYGVFATKLTYVELHSSGFVFMGMLKSIIREYLVSDGSPKAVQTMVDRWSAESGQIIRTSIELNRSIEQFLLADDVE